MDPNMMLLRFQGVQEQVEKEELIFNLKASKYCKTTLLQSYRASSCASARKEAGEHCQADRA
jgi:hypothetical protein